MVLYAEQLMALKLFFWSAETASCLASAFSTCDAQRQHPVGQELLALVMCRDNYAIWQELSAFVMRRDNILLGKSFQHF